MRFKPEISEDANAGLHIVRDMLHLVQKKYPQISQADLWAFAGCVAIEFMGGPMPPFKFGAKTMTTDGAARPTNGCPMLPWGPITCAKCSIVNSYFKNLVDIEWKPKDWYGKFQYTDPTDTLVMLPTDIALIEDPAFRVHVEKYAADQELFFKDFAAATGKLMCLGYPAECAPSAEPPASSESELAGELFREPSMHGSLGLMRWHAEKADVHEVEQSSGRTALHEAAFWGHIEAVRYLANELKLDPDAQDLMGDTLLHDVAQFGHKEVVQILVDAGSDLSLTNSAGMNAHELAVEYGKDEVAQLLGEAS